MSRIVLNTDDVRKNITLLRFILQAFALRFGHTVKPGLDWSKKSVKHGLKNL